MGALDPREQRRLQSALALLASDRDGEVLAAARAVQRLLAKAGARFSDLELPAAMPPPRQSHDRPKHQRRAVELLASGYDWTPWALAFLEEISTWRSPLSPRQAEILAELETEAMDRAA